VKEYIMRPSPASSQVPCTAGFFPSSFPFFLCACRRPFFFPYWGPAAVFPDGDDPATSFPSQRPSEFFDMMVVGFFSFGSSQPSFSFLFPSKSPRGVAFFPSLNLHLPAVHLPLSARRGRDFATWGRTQLRLGFFSPLMTVPT